MNKLARRVKTIGVMAEVPILLLLGGPFFVIGYAFRIMWNGLMLGLGQPNRRM